MGLIVLIAFIVAILVALGIPILVFEASIEGVGRRFAGGVVTVLGEPLSLALAGAALIVFSVCVLLRMYQRRRQTSAMLDVRSTSGFTRTNLLVGIGIVVLIAVVGVALLSAAVTTKPGAHAF